MSTLCSYYEILNQFSWHVSCFLKITFVCGVCLPPKHLRYNEVLLIIYVARCCIEFLNVLIVIGTSSYLLGWVWS